MCVDKFLPGQKLNQHFLQWKRIIGNSKHGHKSYDD